MQTSSDMHARQPERRSYIEKQSGPKGMLRRLRLGEELIRLSLVFCGVLSIFTTIGIIVVLGTETSLFIGSRAYIFTQVPVFQGEALGALIEDISADTTSILIDNTETELLPDQFLFVNTELMQVQSVAFTAVNLSIERGAEATAVRDHPAGEPIYLVETTQIAETQDEIESESDELIIRLEETTNLIAGQNLIQVGDEILLVTETGNDLLSLGVERGQFGTAVGAIAAGTPVNLLTLTPVGALSEDLPTDAESFPLELDIETYALLSNGATLQIGEESNRELITVADFDDLRREIIVARGVQGSTAEVHPMNDNIRLIFGTRLEQTAEQDAKTLFLDSNVDMPFSLQQYLWINGEVVQVAARGLHNIDVKRGQDGRPRLSHESGSLIFPMTQDRVRPVEEVPSVQSIERVAWENLDVEHVAVGDEVRYLNQTWEVGNFNSANFSATCVESDNYNLSNLEGFVPPRGLAVGDSISDGRTTIRWIVREAEDNRILASCDPGSTTQILWALYKGDRVLPGDHVVYQDLTWRVTDYNQDTAQLERCEAGQMTTIPLRANYGRAFKSGEFVQIHLEVMRVESATADSVTVERCMEGTDGYAHGLSEGQYEAFMTGQNASVGEFITSTNWQPQIGNFGIWPLLTATLLTSIIAMFVAIPMGLGAAIYLSEYASTRLSAILTPILEILAGIPTVVFGFFALTWMTPALRSIFGDQVQNQNLLSAGMVVGILIIPYIASLSRDAINAVPLALREASYGLGATKLETIVKVVIPAAISGIFAAFILGVSRAVGETMVVTIASGSGPNFTFNVFDGAETMTGHIARISGGDLSYNSIDYNSIFAIAFVLFLFTLALNLISNYVSNRLREAY